MTATKNDNSALYFIDRHIAEGRGSKVAFIQGGRSLSFATLKRDTDRMVGFYEALGVARESRLFFVRHQAALIVE